MSDHSGYKKPPPPGGPLDFSDKWGARDDSTPIGLVDKLLATLPEGNPARFDLLRLRQQVQEHELTLSEARSGPAPCRPIASGGTAAAARGRARGTTSVAGSTGAEPERSKRARGRSRATEPGPAARRATRARKSLMRPPGPGTQHAGPA